MTEHKFGGAWTRRKIGILEKYLSFYTKALKRSTFTLHYADAFAGTGTHTPVKLGSPQETFLALEGMKGSVKTALDIEPGFDHYHFNDLDPEHVQALKRLSQEYPSKKITITEKDANDFVPEFCNSLTGKDRAVLFIDPYSSQLDWNTLKFIQQSEKVDVWLLFPLSVILRMAPTDADRVQPEWNDTLNRLLGNDEWQQALYKPVEKAPMEDLFGSSDMDEDMARVNWHELQNWVTGRLREQFPYVSEPVELKSNNRPLFSFYFLVSNPSEKAKELAQRVVKHILSKERLRP